MVAFAARGSPRMSDASLSAAAHLVTAAVGALSSSGDKYGGKLYSWLAKVVVGERPYRLPRLEDVRMGAALFQRRNAVRVIAKEYRDLLCARWLAKNTARKAKRKVERQAERRRVRRQLERQNDKPAEDYVYSDGGLSDDDTYLCLPDNPPVPSDGPIACSDYELKRLQTMVAVILVF